MLELASTPHCHCHAELFVTHAADFTPACGMATLTSTSEQPRSFGHDSFSLLEKAMNTKRPAPMEQVGAAPVKRRKLAPPTTKRPAPEESNGAAPTKRRKVAPKAPATPSRRSTRRIAPKTKDVNIFHEQALDEKQLEMYTKIEAARDAVVFPHEEAISKTKQLHGADTYGELSFWFQTALFRKTGLTSEHVFVDLGSGVGNIVLQAALETGCTAYGCELNSVCANLAAPFHADLLARCTTDVERRRLTNTARKERVRFVEGDIFKNDEVGSWIPQADLVLCTNLKFSFDMNDELLVLAMQMKPGARMATLSPLFLGTYAPGEQSPMKQLAEERCRAREGESRWTWGAFDWYLYTKRD
ncbi:MAG: Nucleosomal histone H3-Lys79 methylase [Chrysothrix sp. TS-e1954]|nr:MAG: Nucleosomal histone H3-Lys79 methylase [Chrysothrix sp. TS-e1954]